MTANIANLKPPIAKGEHRGHRGRAPGVLNRVTRAMKVAALDAAELSKHSADGTLTGYLRFLADDHPTAFANILTRLIPVQAKIDSDVRIDFDKIRRLTADMPLDEMVRTFEAKIKSPDYMPRSLLIEQNTVDGDDESDEH